jgi:peptide/nickel transport system substrate-binding protein
VGTGPFRVQEFVRGTHILLRAYDHYVLGRPKLDEVEIRFIPDQNAIVASVLGGAIDLTLGRGISLEQALQLRDQWRDGKVDIAFTSWIVSYPQFLNPSPPIVGDERFRRALMHGVDRAEMAETLQAGLVPVADTFIHPNEPEYRDVEPRIVRYEYDPRRSSQMIEDLGYVRGADGFRDAAGGRLGVEIRTSPEQDIQVKTILVLADHWKRVGVAADPIVMAEQRVRDREYVQTFPAFMTYRQPNAPTALLLRLYSSQTPLPENNFVGRNHPRYMNPAFDALIDRYYTTIPRAERAQVLGEIVNHTTDQLTLMGLFFDVEPVLVGTRLQNVAAARATESTPVWNAERWDVR